MSKYIQCKVCGAYIFKDAKFCFRCGHKNDFKPAYAKWWFWLLIVLLCVALASGGNSEEPGQISNDAQLATEPKTVLEDITEPQTATEPKPVFEEIIVVDNDECTIKITGIDPDDFWGYTLKVYLENKSADKTYMFTERGASVDGVETNPVFATEVAPGKKANKEISFSDDVLEEVGIKFTDIEITFCVYDYNDWLADPVALETINVYPYGIENAVNYVREVQDTDIVLVDNEYVTAIVTGFDPDRILGYTVNLYLVNKTDTHVMFTVDEESVNGYMLNPFWSTSVLPGKCKFSSMSWSDSLLEENGITDIEEIEFIFKAYDKDRYTSSFIEQVFILYPKNGKASAVQ